VGHPGTALMQKAKMIDAVGAAKGKADLVIVSMHSGIEYTGKPNDSQIDFAHGAIDAGADLVIGHHPHVVQMAEKYKGKYIFYSLGNFIFDQMWSQETREGLMIKIYFSKTGVSKISPVPIIIENYSQPRIANSAEAEKILKRLSIPLEKEEVYYWDESKNNFEKGTRAVIRNGAENVNVGNLQSEQADLDQNGVLERYDLKNGRLVISEGSKGVWSSLSDWWIDGFDLADVDNDGTTEVNLSLWKAGDFGTSKPFWVKENDMSVKNHFFVYKYISGKMKPVWHSSNLSAPNCEFKIADVDNDGKNELIVVEGDYSQSPNCKGIYLALWRWNGWGFSNEWRSEKGVFSNLEVEKIDGKDTLIANPF